MYRVSKLHLIGEEKGYSDFIMSSELLRAFKTLPSHLQQDDSCAKVLGSSP
jgi:hypothetical protein